jgi:hypothetical protein
MGPKGVDPNAVQASLGKARLAPSSICWSTAAIIYVIGKDGAYLIRDAHTALENGALIGEDQWDVVA